MRRSNQPSRPSASTCCFLLSLKTLPSVMNVHDLPSVGCDRVIVATLDNPDDMISTLIACGIPRDRLICLHPEGRTTGQRDRQDAAVTPKAVRR